ncbi:helix-turn-helix transcriptional regulator [Antarcticibacterium arcticum]|uniref:Helix-turn-helix transcriptional regulator n=1 Tax=Antarcticibacterium arcticum TaxID=2585771 RepID=A0A5B8YS62_9FLAO|nr:helix-turn-helix transcriptional regulator [Antarcticibacterium arcticum]QED39069.1 helix-turn-helix transcriptional regulator [Antarcticibacterium arcticum]
MVNSEHFSKRLEKILDYYDISAATFAEAIDVGRSSISHILSGRNKPSLDFVMKVVQTYPEVELYWLLNGKGNFPSSSPSSEKVQASPASSPSSANPAPLSLNNVNPGNSPKDIADLRTNSGKKIRKIVFFYEDGSFEAFEN